MYTILELNYTHTTLGLYSTHCTTNKLYWNSTIHTTTHTYWESTMHTTLHKDSTIHI